VFRHCLPLPQLGRNRGQKGAFAPAGSGAAVAMARIVIRGRVGPLPHTACLSWLEVKAVPEPAATWVGLSVRSGSLRGSIPEVACGNLGVEGGRSAPLASVLKGSVSIARRDLGSDHL
jgi:hypothetical protein